MKVRWMFIFFAALNVVLPVMSSSLVPNVAGTVTSIKRGPAGTEITINGKVYTSSSDANEVHSLSKVQVGQTITIYLSSDGRTIKMIEPAKKVTIDPR